jgi:type I restriction enzyme S subunit
MKLETFFDKFDHFADAPDAVAKMREVILDWALMGRLVSQDPNDEPAAELAVRIRAERKRQVKDGKPGKLTDYPALPTGTRPGKIPLSWAAWLGLEQPLPLPHQFQNSYPPAPPPAYPRNRKHRTRWFRFAR